MLPLKQITRVQCVSPQLEHAPQLSRRGGRPEAELLHEAGALRLDEFLELVVEFGEFGVVLNVVKRLVVARVALVFPDVDESIAITDFGAPGADEVDLVSCKFHEDAGCPLVSTYLVLRHVCHTWVPLANKLHIFVHLARLDFVEDNAVYILATGEHLREAALDILIHLPALFSAVDQLGQRARADLLLLWVILGGGCGWSCCGL